MELIACKASGISYPRHNHVSTVTAGVILDGAVEVVTDRGRRVFRRGEAFAIPPYAAHGLNAREDYSLLCLCVRREHGEIAGFLREAAGWPEAEGMLLKALDSTGWPGPAPGPVDAPRRRLEAEPERRWSLDELAELAFMSKYHLLREFKREVGLTPHQFQIQNRVRKAQRLLESSVGPAEAALSAGFCDQSHLARCFAKIVGLTPGEYQRACRQWVRPGRG